MSILFISHSAPDNEIAEALDDAIRKLLGENSNEIKVRYSSSADHGPHGGEEWRSWIETQILGATTALIILTRESVTRHWPIWEAAACRGVSLAREQNKIEPRGPKIVALTFGISDVDCPDPFKKEQISSGTNPDDVENIFLQILEYHCIDPKVQFKAGQKLPEVLEQYLTSVKKTLLNTSSLVTEASVQDWLSRLNSLISEKRWSELGSFQRRMEVAFGYSKTTGYGKTTMRQIDLRLHRRLGECHLEQQNFEEAASQLRCARESAPRDVYVLSRLAEALIKHILKISKNNEKSDASSLQDEDKEKIDKLQDEVEEIIEKTNSLDPEILYSNPDSAAVSAKYHRRIKGDTQEALRIYRKSFQLNPESYYLADVLGQTLIEEGEFDAAKKTYKKAEDILKRIHDHNIWSLATSTTAYLVLGKSDLAIQAASEIVSLNPTANQTDSMIKGVSELCEKLQINDDIKIELIRKLEGAR